MRNLDEALAADDVSGIVAAMQSQVTEHAGTAPAKVKQAAIRRISRHYSGNPERGYGMAIRLCQSGNWTAEEVGAALLAPCYEVHPSDVANMLETLADSSNWEVREWAASACGAVLADHFDAFYPALVTFAHHPSENIRRAAVLAAMYAGQSRNPTFANPLLDLLEILIADPSKYVRDNLGPFAIGSSLIQCYPDKVIQRMQEWVQREDEQVRWNVAMVFSAAAGASYAPDAPEVFRILRQDKRTSVQKAVAKATKAIQKKFPDWSLSE